jgi:hypothetical protein
MTGFFALGRFPQGRREAAGKQTWLVTGPAPDGCGSDEQIFEGYGSNEQIFGAKQQVPHAG